MITIFIDSECKCHVTNPDGIFTEVEAPEDFVGKCDTYIEGFRVRPEGYSYTRDDGVVFGPNGSSVSPWKPFGELDAAQRQYEREQLRDMENALAILLGGETA